MASKRQTAEHLARALLAGIWEKDAMMQRARRALMGPLPWLDTLIPTILTCFGKKRRPLPAKLRNFILCSPGFSTAWMNPAGRPCIDSYPLEPALAEQPEAWCSGLELPQLTTPADVAEWLGVTTGELDWFADVPGRQGKIPEGPLHHYIYQWRDKRSGSLPRLIESPKSRLKTMQRKILREILSRVPVHEAAHGFQPGRSCLSFAAPHCGREVVMRMDLEDFFPSITAARVHGLFHALGYSWEVTRLLSGLCTHTATDLFRMLPPAKRPPWRIRKRYLQPHLPQGAPTSPALANLCAFRLDCRLAGLAEKLGLSYTRYADDLAFSGELRSVPQCDRMHVLVTAIALEEGFVLNTRKTRVMRQGVSQRLTGLVVNRCPNIPRQDYDRLKATLFNCKRLGPETQNHDAHNDFCGHLAGRVAWVESVNPERGQRLRKLFDGIDW